MPLPQRLLALLLAASAVLASPAPAPVPADATTDAASYPTEAWVSVGSDGVAKTITPVLTTIDGTPAVVSAAPTTSGTATTTAQPEATATSGAGSFPVCSNVDGDLAPFCAPSDGSTLNPGVTYYITWDSAFFASYPNTTVIVTGNLFNATTGAITTQAFSSNTLAAGWSFYAWTVDKALLSGASSQGVNISLSLSYLASSSSNSSTHIHGPVVRVAKPEPYRQPKAELPTGAALYIGLPCVFAFVVIMLVGTCIWNRRARRIGLGNVMGRSRFGQLGKPARGYGIGRSRRQRVGAVNLDSKEAIRLQNREVSSSAAGASSSSSSSGGNNAGDDDGYDDYGMTRPGAPQYSDAPKTKNSRSPPSLALSGDHWAAAPERPRRDSDALGSLAGTPTDERFGESRPRTAHGETGSSGNAFRDELRRQENLI